MAVFDAATNGGNVTATSQTYAHTTTTNANRFLWQIVLGKVSATSVITGITYNGVALTLRDGAQLSPADRYFEAWYLIAPSTGANNIVVSASESSFISGSTSTYYSASQGALDATVTNFQLTGDPNTNTLTTVADNSWHIMGGANASGVPTAGTGSTLRATANGNSAIFDGNGAITPAGSNSIGMSGMNTLFGSGTIGISLAPFVAPSGPANLKSRSGNLKANIKTNSGNTLANMKSLSGNS